MCYRIYIGRSQYHQKASGTENKSMLAYKWPHQFQAPLATQEK